MKQMIFTCTNDFQIINNLISIIIASTQIWIHLRFVHYRCPHCISVSISFDIFQSVGIPNVILRFTIILYTHTHIPTHTHTYIHTQTNGCSTYDIFWFHLSYHVTYSTCTLYHVHEIDFVHDVQFFFYSSYNKTQFKYLVLIFCHNLSPI